MLFIRSLLFNVAFYLSLAALMIFGLPTLFMGRKAVFWLARGWVTARSGCSG